MHLLGDSLSERDQRKWESKLSSKRIFVTNKFPTRNINFQAISLPFLGRFWAKQPYFVLSAQAPLSHSALTSKLGKRRRMKLRKAPIRPSSLTRTMRKYLTFNSDHQLPLLRSSHCLPSQFSWLKTIIPMETSGEFWIFDFLNKKISGRTKVPLCSDRRRTMSLLQSENFSDYIFVLSWRDTGIVHRTWKQCVSQ